ncbi:MAG: TatD family hydrolase [Clostridiales bacterium]|nr:TatD family hydrolase [Clostridiales bacterium]
MTRKPRWGSASDNSMIDVHCHYHDSRFDSYSDEEGADSRDSLIKRLAKSGIILIENGTNLKTNEEALNLAARHDNMYAAVGIYPGESDIPPEDEDAVLERLEEQLLSPKVVAVGEIGLDYYWDEPDREIQKRWFGLMLDLAEKHDLPVEIHNRESHGDMVEILSQRKNSRGLMHCFSGSAETARQLTSMGWHISFGGSVTFKNAKKTAAAAAVVPDDLLLIETDCPYMAPMPHRGKTNRSDWMKYTVERLAEIRGQSPERIVEITTRNAKKLFKI